MYPIEKRCSQAQRTLELKRLKTEKPQVTSEKEKNDYTHLREYTDVISCQVSLSSSVVVRTSNLAYFKTQAQKCLFEDTDRRNKKNKGDKSMLCFLLYELMRSNPVLVFEVVVGFVSLFS